MVNLTTKRVFNYCLVGILAGALSACSYLPERKTDVPTVTKRFQKALDVILVKDGLPGATAAFILPDGTVVGVASGLSDTAKNIAMRKDAQQPIGSVEESFDAVVALSLQQEGTINLDDRVYQIFDTEDRDAWLLEIPNAKRLTLRHLLSHSSGLVDKTSDSEVLTSVESAWTEGEIRFAVDADSAYPPGKGFMSSTADYRFAAMVIEQVTDEKFHSLLEKHVLEPNELTRTESLLHAKPENISPGYRKDSESGDVVTVNSQEMLNKERSTARHDGGLLSNPQDLVRWAQLLYEEDALEGAYLEDLLASGYRGENRSEEFGLGVYVHSTTAGEAYGHYSTVPGYETSLIYFPKYKVGVCIQVNRDYENDLRKYVESLAQVVLNAIPR